MGQMLQKLEFEVFYSNEQGENHLCVRAYFWKGNESKLIKDQATLINQVESLDRKLESVGFKKSRDEIRDKSYVSDYTNNIKFGIGIRTKSAKTAKDFVRNLMNIGEVFTISPNLINAKIDQAAKQIVTSHRTI